jgi:hypothetical protein
MAGVPIYLAVARIAENPGGVTVTGTHETTVALGVADVPLPDGISHWETKQAIAAVLYEHGWRVAGKWDDCLGDVAWSVTVERVVTCVHCRSEIWWRIPARVAGLPGILGAWCDTDLDDTCTAGGERPHEPRRTEAE